ncbi:MAG: NfeD family protein [Muribaculaceae bacterium]|nr:NfeD family protein [Muribaculaceae bacterium]
MSVWIIWLSVAAILLIIEVLTQMFWTLCLAIGCVGALAGNLLGVGTAWEMIIMAGVSFVAYAFLAPVFQRWHQRQLEKNGRKDRTGMDALLGRRAVVTSEIKPGETGRARIDGDSWQVVAPGVHETVRKGSEVIVEGYNSIILTVSTRI